MVSQGSLKVFDLFVGCGGLSMGLTQAGLQVQWAVEMNEGNTLNYCRLLY